MKAARHLVTAVLIIVLLSSGIPLFTPEDTNRNSIIDLGDAILSVRDFVRSAENPETFTSHIERTLTTLHIAAGMKTVIKAAGSEKSLNTVLSLNFPSLISSNAFFINPGFTSEIPEYTFQYESIACSTESPPPRHCPIT